MDLIVKAEIMPNGYYGLKNLATQGWERDFNGRVRFWAQEKDAMYEASKINTQS